VETLLDRGADGDVAEAEAAIEWLAAAPADAGLVIREVWLLRLRSGRGEDGHGVLVSHASSRRTANAQGSASPTASR
jgi:hypothetical protein